MRSESGLRGFSSTCWVRQQQQQQQHDQQQQQQQKEQQIEKKKLRGWKKYADEFKDAPASHLMSFAILHELTAIIPLPIIYYILSSLEEQVEEQQQEDNNNSPSSSSPSSSSRNLIIRLIPHGESILAEGNRRMTRLLQLIGFSTAELSDDSTVMVNLATSYAIVKVLMPVRIGACFLMTPWFA
ncbi:hypothetical protein HK102_004437, partial [Quaeritorhiza haematococci]